MLRACRKEQEGVTIDVRGNPGVEDVIDIREAKHFMKESVANNAQCPQKSQGLLEKCPWNLVKLGSHW